LYFAKLVCRLWLFVVVTSSTVLPRNVEDTPLCFSGQVFEQNLLNPVVKVPNAAGLPHGHLVGDSDFQMQ
jgi:hypothetical protein